MPFAPHATTASCTDEQIDAFLACIPRHGVDAGAACERFDDAGTDADRACADCLFPASPTGGLGAVVGVHGWPNVATNVAGCVALATGDATDAGCAEAFAGAAGCAEQTCSLRCSNAAEAPTYACLQAAFTKTDCSIPLSFATCITGDSGVASSCGVFAATYEDQFRAVARRFCGGGPSDAGAD